jgi:hypothetical protein
MKILSSFVPIEALAFVRSVAAVALGSSEQEKERHYSR